MASKKLSRRELLKIAGVGAGTAAFAGLNGAALADTTYLRPQFNINKQEPVTLKMWRWGGNAQEIIMDAAVRGVFPELNETSTTDVLVVGSGDFAVAEQFRLALAAGPGPDFPDLIMLNRTQVTEFARAGVLADLDDAFAPHLDNIYPGVVSMAQDQGRFICIPREFKSKMFFYRADMFEEAGIKVEDVQSVESFIEAGMTLRETFPNTSIINMGTQPVQYYTHIVLSAYDDPRFANEDGTFRVTTEPAFADMFKLWKDIYDSGVTLPIEDWSADWQQSFVDNAIAGILTANWMKYFLPGFAPMQSGLWKAAMWPSFSPLADQSYGSEAGGAVFVIPADSPHRDLAIDYAVKQVLEPQGALALFNAVGRSPVLATLADQVIDIVANAEKPADMSDEQWQTHPFSYLGAEFQEVEFATYERHKTFPFDPQATAEITILLNWLHQYMDGRADLESALANAQADMELQIGNPYLV
jgi:multiple sugar transport system substrate-binding protein